mmetsp:Transcript_30703/g.94012  ORF Transcript_30703/g.94012 Transcript_30703/m.94012 type:complete len:85 (-) Transcript_30703:384-638(-)
MNRVRCPRRPPSLPSFSYRLCRSPPLLATSCCALGFLLRVVLANGTFVLTFKRAHENVNAIAHLHEVDREVTHSFERIRGPHHM